MSRFKVFLPIVAIVLILSCQKQSNGFANYQGDLPILSVTSPINVNQNDTILSNVKCGLTTQGGTVTFLGFNVIQDSLTEFTISAMGYFEQLENQNTPKNWEFNQTLGLVAKEKKRYILKFYNGATLFQRDTVEVK